MPRPKSNKPKKGFMDGYKTFDPADGLGYGSVEQWRDSWESMPGDEASKLLGTNDPLAVLGFDSLPTRVELFARMKELRSRHTDCGGNHEDAKKFVAAFTQLLERTN